LRLVLERWVTKSLNGNGGTPAPATGD
jgi:hypothetical protein